MYSALMHLTSEFKESDQNFIEKLIEGNPLGSIVWSSRGELEAEHIPFLADRSVPGSLLLRAHVAETNPIVAGVESGSRVLVSFQGPNGYISPSWYVTKKVTHRLVPTWNYEVVHAHGEIRFFRDQKALRGLLARLTRRGEGSMREPWKMTDAPASFIEEQLRKIVGIEVRVDRLECRRKMSQNRSDQDIRGVTNALFGSDQHALAQAIALANEDRLREGL